MERGITFVPELLAVAVLSRRHHFEKQLHVLLLLDRVLHVDGYLGRQDGQLLQLEIGESMEGVDLLVVLLALVSCIANDGVGYLIIKNIVCVYYIEMY